MVSLLAGQLSNTFTLPQIAIGYAVLAALATLITLLGARNPNPERDSRPYDDIVDVTGLR